MITIKDDLTDSSGALSPNTQIDVITTQGAGTTLTSATYSYTTDENGHYEFTLNNGVHVLSVKYNGYSKGLGEVYVNDDTPSPITINDLLGLHSPIPPSYVQTIIDSLNEATQARDEAVSAANDSADILVQNQTIQSDVTNKATQVSQDAIQVSQDKADVEASAQQVAIDKQDVSNKAQQVSNDAAQVTADKQSVEQTASDVATAQAVIGTSIDGVYANAAGLVSINDTILRLHPII